MWCLLTWVTSDLVWVSLHYASVLFMERLTLSSSSDEIWSVWLDLWYRSSQSFSSLSNPFSFLVLPALACTLSLYEDNRTAWIALLSDVVMWHHSFQSRCLAMAKLIPIPTVTQDYLYSVLHWLVMETVFQEPHWLTGVESHLSALDAQQQLTEGASILADIWH